MEDSFRLALGWGPKETKNSLLFLSMSFYLTVKGNMNSQEFIVVGLSILGIYVFGNIASKKVGNQTNDKTKGEN